MSLRRSIVLRSCWMPGGIAYGVLVETVGIGLAALINAAGVREL